MAPKRAKRSSRSGGDHQHDEQPGTSAADAADAGGPTGDPFAFDAACLSEHQLRERAVKAEQCLRVCTPAMFRLLPLDARRNLRLVSRADRAAADAQVTGLEWEKKPMRVGVAPPFRLDTCAKRWPQARHLRLAFGADLRLDRPPAAAGGTGGTVAAVGMAGTAAAGGGTGNTAGTGGTGGTGGLQGVPPRLESLCLVGCLERPSALLLSPLAALAPTLRRLELYRCPIGDGDAALAATLRQLTALQSLTLSQNALDDPHAVCQAMCGGELAGLTELSFTGEPGDAEAVAAALPSAAGRLRSLRLSLGMGRCGAVAVAPALSRLTALRTLDLRGNRLGNTDTQSDLDQLAGIGIGAPGASGMAALAPAIACLTSLDTLGLSYNGLRAAVGLLPLEALSGLTCLDLQSNDLKGAGRHLAAALALPMLRQLNLAFNDLTVDDVEHLSRMLVQLAPSLQVLRLERGFAAAAAPLLVTAVGKLQCLEELHMQDNPLSHSSKLLAEQLCSLAVLRQLSLGNARMTTGVAPVLAQALGCMPQLEVFDIQCNKFNDASAAALATPISLLKRLRDINASGNAWTAKGIAKLLASLQSLLLLESVQLHPDTPHTPAEAEALVPLAVSLRWQFKLHRLLLGTGIAVKEDSRRAVAAALPGVQFRF